MAKSDFFRANPKVDVSRFSAALNDRSGHFPFEGDRANPTQF